MRYSSCCSPSSVVGPFNRGIRQNGWHGGAVALGGTWLTLATLILLPACSGDSSDGLGAGGSSEQDASSKTTGSGAGGPNGGKSGAGGGRNVGDAAGEKLGAGGTAGPGQVGSAGHDGVGGRAASGGNAGTPPGTAGHSGGHAAASEDGGTGQGGAQGGRGNRADAAVGAGGQNASPATDGGVAPDSATGGVGPCDIYQQANTPCVAAHSTVRALYGAYSGNLYQLRRASDKTTKDVPVLAPGGFVDISVQDTFCAGTTCTISIIYDQSPNKNDLAKSPKATWLDNGGNEANAADGKVTVGGHVAHGIYVTGYSSNVAYRNNSTKGVAKKDEAEAMYMVVDGKRYSDQCCFDYGNAETSGKDDGNGTMEALYFGNDITWGGKGEGSGPWVAADLENGVFKGDKGGWKSQDVMTSSAKSIKAAFATGMLKGPSGNHFTLKGGDAQSGTLTTMWDGKRPSPNYSPKTLQGAIILGTGGDGSNGGTGTFFEGAMTIGNPPDATDEAVQANIVAAGYGR